jgi:microcin C transport system permease protein
MQVLQPSFWLLVVILAAFEWMGMTYYIRGEFYREKAKDYVAAAIVTGVSELGIMFRHILPNALTPVVSFAPFTVVANISALVALDFLGFGLPPPTPSWGELIGQGMANLTKPWLVFFPLGVLFTTLLLVVFIGEAVREAFDPKEYSRLR